MRERRRRRRKNLSVRSDCQVICEPLGWIQFSLSLSEYIFIFYFYSVPDTHSWTSSSSPAENQAVVFSQLIQPKLQSAGWIHIKGDRVCVCPFPVDIPLRLSLSLFLRSICRQSQSTRSYLSLSPSFSSDLAGGCRAKSISAGSAQSPWQLNATSFSSPLRHSPPFRLSLFLRHKVSLYLSVEIKGRE